MHALWCLHPYINHHDKRCDDQRLEAHCTSLQRWYCQLIAWLAAYFTPAKTTTIYRETTEQTKIKTNVGGAFYAIQPANESDPGLLHLPNMSQQLSNSSQTLMQQVSIYNTTSQVSVTATKWYTTLIIIIIISGTCKPLGVGSTKCRHQSPEWTILSHVNCFI